VALLCMKTGAEEVQTCKWTKQEEWR
jgi:hypothetical protein